MANSQLQPFRPENSPDFLWVETRKSRFFLVSLQWLHGLIHTNKVNKLRRNRTLSCFDEALAMGRFCLGKLIKATSFQPKIHVHVQNGGIWKFQNNSAKCHFEWISSQAFQDSVFLCFFNHLNVDSKFSLRRSLRSCFSARKDPHQTPPFVQPPNHLARNVTLKRCVLKLVNWDGFSCLAVWKFDVFQIAFFSKIQVITPSTSRGRFLYSTNYHSTTIFTFSQNSSLTLKPSKKPLSFLLKALHTKSLWQFWSEVLVGWICDSNRNIKWMYQQVTSHVTNNTILTLYWLNTDLCKLMFGKISQIEAGTSSFVGC